MLRFCYDVVIRRQKQMLTLLTANSANISLQDIKRAVMAGIQAALQTAGPLPHPRIVLNEHILIKNFKYNFQQWLVRLASTLVSFSDCFCCRIMMS